MTKLTGHQRLVRHRIGLCIVTVGLIAGYILAAFFPNLTHHYALVSLATGLIWVWNY